MKTKRKQTHKRVRPIFHVKSGDFVRVITGDYKGVEGKILKVNLKKSRVFVEGVTKVKKAIRPNQQNPQGGYAEIDRAIHVSNVRKIEPEVKAEKEVPKKAAKKAAKKKPKSE